MPPERSSAREKARLQQLYHGVGHTRRLFLTLKDRATCARFGDQFTVKPISQLAFGDLDGRVRKYSANRHLRKNQPGLYPHRRPLANLPR